MLKYNFADTVLEDRPAELIRASKSFRLARAVDMSVNLNKYKAELVKAWEELHDPKSDNDW